MKKRGILNLEKTIKQAAQDYYVGKPTITDEQFDSLVDNLRKQDPTNETLTTVGWGYDVSKVSGNKINHKFGQVGSLSKIHSMHELPNTFTHEITVAAKLDGASCVAYFENGQLVNAVSRGDGITGVDCTEKFKKIVDKNDLNLFGFTGAVRGEIVFSNKDWENYLGIYPDAKFPRNVATGLFMRDEVSDDLSYVRFVAYKIHGSQEYKGSILYSSMLKTLDNYGFDVVPHKVLFKSTLNDEVMEQLFKDYAKIYPVDGLVIQQETVLIESDGRFAYRDIAYKFKAEEKETIVKSVEWNLSKNNIMVPLVWIEPVELSGAVVQKTSGFNYDYITNNKVGEGCKIKIMRSGEVIPHITEILQPSDNLIIPETCPVCGSKLKHSGVELICDNASCPNVEKSRLISWVEIVGVRDMLGVGPAILESFVENYSKCINKQATVFDLYSEETRFDKNRDLTNEFINMFTPAIQEKLSDALINLYTPIDKYKLLLAMNIRNLGKTICEKICDIVYDAFQLQDESDQNYELNKISQISGIGLHAQNCVLNARKVIERLMYVVPAKQSNKPSNCSYIAKITVTGALSISRKEFDMLCYNNNIELSENIKGSDYLVTNNPNSGSSKLQKAKKLGIEIITEQEFYSLYKIK